MRVLRPVRLFRVFRRTLFARFFIAFVLFHRRPGRHLQRSHGYLVFELLFDVLLALVQVADGLGSNILSCLVLIVGGLLNHQSGSGKLFGQLLLVGAGALGLRLAGLFRLAMTLAAAGSLSSVTDECLNFFAFECILELLLQELLQMVKAAAY